MNQVLLLSDLLIGLRGLACLASLFDDSCDSNEGWFSLFILSYSYSIICFKNMGIKVCDIGFILCLCYWVASMFQASVMVNISFPSSQGSSY